MAQRSECKRLYVLVTADEYELPLMVEDSRCKLARAMGDNCSNITSKIKRCDRVPIGAPRRNIAEKTRIRIVELDGDDE